MNTIDTHSVPDTQTEIETRKSNLLTLALRANSAFCASSGLLLLAAANPIAEFMGIEDTDMLGTTTGGPFLFGMGIALILYAGLLAWMLSNRGPRDTGLLATTGDIAWVIGSIILLVTDALELTTGGNWAVLIVGDIVLTFAIVQIIGLRRMKARA